MKLIKLVTVLSILFVVISLMLISFLVTSTGVYSKNINKFSNGLSGEQLVTFLGYENRFFKDSLPDDFEEISIAGFGFELITNIDLGDTRSLLGRELPGLADFDTRIIVPGDGTDLTNLPMESAPPMEVLLAERQAIQEMLEEEDGVEKVTEEEVVLADSNRVLIHHSHSWESFLPHLPGVKSPNSAVHNEMNITKVGKNLGEELEKRGIKTIVDTSNMTNEIHDRGKNASQAYNVSREIIENHLKEDEEITYIFDLHRDSARADVTTVTINNKPYARVFFVIGEGHPNYEKNLELATLLHNKLEEEFPGISRGIFGKDASQGNGIYNQDLSNDSILIEFGGVDNSMDELIRSTEAFAEVFSNYYKENHTTDE